jgi:hypothetical protein
MYSAVKNNINNNVTISDVPITFHSISNITVTTINAMNENDIADSNHQALIDPEIEYVNIPQPNINGNINAGINTA